MEEGGRHAEEGFGINLMTIIAYSGGDNMNKRLIIRINNCYTHEKHRKKKKEKVLLYIMIVF